MKTVALADVVQRIDYGLTTSAVSQPVGPRFLRITDIDNASVDWHTVPFCDASESEATKYALRDGDLVVARTGASTGRSAFIQDAPDAVFASYLVRFRANAAAEPRFLGYVLRSAPWHDFVHAHAQGKSAQPNMSASLMAEFQFGLPPLGEQRAIAEVLGALDDKIAANSKLAATLLGLSSAVLELASAEVETVALSDISTVVMGTSPTGDTLNERGEGIEFFQGVRDFGLHSPSTRVHTSSPVRVAEANSTLLSVRAPIGRVNFANRRVAIGRGVASVTSRVRRPFLLLASLLAAHRQWEPFESEGTVFASVNRKQIEAIRLPDFEQDMATRLESKLEAIHFHVESTLRESGTLAETRDALLPHLMSGRLTVRDAKKTVEDLA